MAMGIRENEQSSLWIATTSPSCPKSPGHPCYTRLNALLDADDFDRFVGSLCRGICAEVIGRPNLRLLPDAAGRLLRRDRFGTGESPVARATRWPSVRPCASPWTRRPPIIRRPLAREARSISRSTAPASRGSRSSSLRPGCSRARPAIDAAAFEANAAMPSIARRDTQEPIRSC
jgi:hypothetical protein